jgi:hypothetical protein
MKLLTTAYILFEIVYTDNDLNSERKLYTEKNFNLAESSLT